MKAIQTNQGGRNKYYIKLLSNINRTGLFSAFAFLLLALTCLFPISKGEQSTEAVTGTAQSSSLTLFVTGDTASVELDVNSTDGTFASSSPDTSAAFSVTTNNFSGYTLSISGNDADGKLYDDTKKFSLESLENAVSEADFSSTSDLNGKWGYKPSKFNSNANENYLPAPTTTASTLDATTTANTTANDYTISLGLRADYETASATYSNAFIITAVPNPIAYVITYDANTTDTVSGMPGAQNSTTSATEITLSGATPTRTNYNFLGWCSVKPTSSNGTDSCSGTTYQPNASYGIDKTTSNVTTLYAMWKINAFTVTFSAGTGGTVDRTSQANAPYGTAVTTNSNKVTINGVTTTATASTDHAFSSWTNNCGTTVTKACTITANFSRQSYTITFTSGTGGTVNRTSQSVPYGTTITVNGNKVTTNGVATVATANSGYNFKSWTNGCGSTMPAKGCTITANWNEATMQNYTKSLCQANASSVPVTLKDIRDNKSYKVRYINGVCTMIDNLDFQITTGMTLYKDTTNVTANRTLATVGSLSSGNTYDEMRILKSGTAGYGTYYNYAAATAGTITEYSNTTEATQDICSKGWKLPSNAEQQSISGGMGWQTGNVSSFNAAAGAAGFYDSGSLRNHGGTVGYWWSSTANGTTRRYFLNYFTSDGLVSGNGNDRSGGLSVRCVLK